MDSYNLWQNYYYLMKIVTFKVYLMVFTTRKKVFNYSSSKKFKKHLSGDIDTLIEDDILGWRFWASFLGIGIFLVEE